MDERLGLERSKIKVLQLATTTDKAMERKYYLAVADCMVNSYGHGAKLLQSREEKGN